LPIGAAGVIGVLMDIDDRLGGFGDRFGIAQRRSQEQTRGRNQKLAP
jgi:hypothetical protein